METSREKHWGVENEETRYLLSRLELWKILSSQSRGRAERILVQDFSRNEIQSGTPRVSGQNLVTKLQNM